MTEQFSSLTDRELVERIALLAAAERAATATLVAAIAEFDTRRLYLGAGCSSLFTYCTQVLHLSESAAYVRIEVARASRRFPGMLERIADGRLSLSSARALAPVLTTDNEVRLLDAAAFQSKRAVEQLVVAERPQPPVASSVRKLPGQSPASASAPATAATLLRDTPMPNAPAQTAIAPPTPAAERPASSAVVRPLAPQIYKVQFTLSSEGHARLRKAQDLMRHTNASGDVAVIFERALTLLINELEKTKFAAARRPRPESPARSRSRHVPSEVKRKVWTRDGGQCAFEGTEGRCSETGLLEYHHAIPFADGGETSVENLQLRCAAHNAYESMLWSGDVVRERGTANGGD